MRRSKQARLKFPLMRCFPSKIFSYFIRSIQLFQKERFASRKLRFNKDKFCKGSLCRRKGVVMNMHIDELPTPCYLIDEAALLRNLSILRGVSRRTGCKILLAQKAFSLYTLYPLIGEYLDGTASSGLYEARLGREHMKGEAHVFSAAYRPDEIRELSSICDHIVFNSAAQLLAYGDTVREFGASVGLRINPEHSTQKGHAQYDPCSVGSRLGIRRRYFDPAMAHQIDGLHFHTLCEQDADALAETLEAVEASFGFCMKQMKWINFGGGHHITREGYQIGLLEKCIEHVRKTYGVQVYLEPGEAVALNAGFLISTVLDVPPYDDYPFAILDTSAACHMPDVLEMPYRPPLNDAGLPGEKPFTYRLGAPTCLAGDVIGDYSFDKPLSPGDRLTFRDMAIYTMVKNNTFNGMPLPTIAVRDAGGVCRILHRFSYDDFKCRLA